MPSMGVAIEVEPENLNRRAEYLVSLERRIDLAREKCEKFLSDYEGKFDITVDRAFRYLVELLQTGVGDKQTHSAESEPPYSQY